MAYASAEIQREYQRQWARKRALIRPKKLSSGVIFSNDLAQLNKINCLNSFNECIQEAKKHFTSKKVSRLAIAALALRSVEIKHGGDRRTQKWRDSKNTLICFSNRIGLNYKTLHRWIEVKTEVIDKLPKSDRVDWTAAHEAVRHSYRLKKTALDLYPRFIGTSKYRRGALVSRYITYAARFISENGKSGFVSEDWELVQNALKILNK